MLEVRKTRQEDLKKIDLIFKRAKAFMKESGNLYQWNGDYPNSSDAYKDMEKGNSYVVLDKDLVVGTFAFIIGEDAHYRDIKDGAWLNNEAYGTIHRIATSGERKGVFEAAFNYCLKAQVDLRIDTHKDNKPMLHLIEKYGFKYCGIVFMDDKTERLAFQLCRKS